MVERLTSRASRTSRRAMAIMAALGVALLLGLMAMPPAQAPLSIEEQEAVDRYRGIMAALHAARAERLDAQTIRHLEDLDPARTGLIGVEWSYLVTTQGDLDAKRASAHPVWTLMFLEWFREAGLRPGDTVAMGCSASFPALLYSLRAAAEARGLRVRVVASLTASNHGATIPEFDLWDMEEAVLRRGLLPPAIVTLTPGGEHDAADYLGDEETRLLRARLDAIAARPGAPQVAWPSSLEDARTLRERLLLDDSESGLAAALFVNIGGNSANMGAGHAALLLPRGFIPARSHALPSADQLRSADYGVIHLALARGLPAIHLLDVRSLLMARGIALGAMSDNVESVYRPAGRVDVIYRIFAILVAAGIIMALFALPREAAPVGPIPSIEEM